MADRVGIDVVATDRGAARLIKSLVDALRLLNTEQAKQARAARVAADAAQNSANSLQARANVYRVLAEQERQRTREMQEQSRARITQIRAERDEEVKAAKTIAAARTESAKGFLAMQNQRLREASKPQTFTDASGKQISFVDEARIAARRRDVAEAEAGVARARAIGRQEIAVARQVGTVETEEINKRIKKQRDLSAARTKQAADAARAARQAESNARSEERAANRAAIAYQRQAAAMGTIRSRTDDLRNRILRLAAAYSGFRAIEGFIGAGLRFNQILESSRLGIGALITAEAELRNEHGELLTGTTALAAAQGLAEDQLKKLRVAGIQTAATTEDLVTSFEEAVGAGLAVGLTLDQIRRFSVSVAQAASAIHLPMNQLQQETRSILQGTIDRNSRIAKALQLTNEEVRLAKEQGRLAQLLEERFKAFNIAGIESVKTFGALRSNIQDAFSVFAGASVQPLFEQLRDAGGKALSEIFDFRSADIAASFRGLVEGLQVLFREIGALFAEAIGEAVNKAQALSEWMQRNKQEVKETAQAIRTMVENFGKMISSLVSAVTMFGTIQGQLNPIEATARLLNAIFKTIAENAKLIVSILTARAFITALLSIGALFSALRGGAIGGVAGPFGAVAGSVIGLILGLGTAYKLLKGDQQEAALETARMTSAMQDQNQQAAELFGTIESLGRQLEDKTLSNEARDDLTAQMEAAMDQMKALEGDYAEAVGVSTDTLEEKRKKLLEVLNVQQNITLGQLFQASDELNRLREQARSARAAVPTGVDAVANPASVARLRAAAEAAEGALVAQEARVNTLSKAYTTLQSTVTKALQAPAKIKFTGRKTDEELNRDINDAVQRAQAELEALREFNQRSRAIVDQEVKNGITSAVSQIEQEKQMALTELSAEMAVAQAQLEAARNRRVEGKVAPDLGAIEAAEIRIQSLIQQRFILEQETEGKRTALRREQAAARTKIEEDHLRALGNRFAATRLEIERKFQKELNDAIRLFGADSEEVIKIRFVIDQEATREQAEAIQDEIKRIQDNLKQEIENARFRILGPETDDRRRRGNAAQRQQIADEIAAANQRAVESTVALRGALIELRDHATDPMTASFIQGLINDLDALKDKANEVDLDLKRLKEGFADALVSGISGFLDSLTDKTKSFGESFRGMVNAILSDISRLVSRLIAEKIVFGFLGLGAAEGGQAGNLTQSQGRAAGGPARPPHGQLRGGIPGVDSIPIMAMPKEYFIRTKAVDYYGADLFEALNSMQMPRINPRTFKNLALGGPASDGAASAARPSRMQIDHHISVDNDGLLRVLKGRPGRDATLGHIHGNPRSVSSALRGRRA